MSAASMPPRPTLTRAGFLTGARWMMPLILPVSIFGLAVGAVAAQKGLTLVELSLMNALVYAGAAQLVALGLWPEQWNGPAVMTVALVTLTVNARLLLMSAAFRPWFGQGNPALAYACLLTLTDANYIAGQRYYAQGGRDIGMFLGAGVLLWVVWMVAPVPGYLAGKLIQNSRAFGIDLVMPIFFSAMVARLWQGRNDSLGWLVAGLVGFAIHRWQGGTLHVVIGSLAGMAVVAFLTPSAPEQEARR